ncbi:hypothetical protein Tco_1381386, partial [Tanacetum coccineum]
MLELKLKSEEDSTMALELIRFIKKLIAKHQELASPEANGFCKELASLKQIALGKDISNPLIVGSLLKPMWLSVHHVIAMKHWLFESKWLLLKIQDLFSKGSNIKSSPEFGGASESGGCGDDKPGGDEDGDEDEEDGDS